MPITEQQVALFGECFAGRTDVHGTYDRGFTTARTVKEPVTDAVIRAHLEGQQPYGVFPLIGDRCRILVADFDHDDLGAPMAFVEAARSYGIPAYIERSKKKGFHLWIFMASALAAVKARMVARLILSDIDLPHTELFPKQDALSPSVAYGNFINTPLFGGLVAAGRTVFVDPADPTQPFDDQWGLLERIQRVPESLLDELIAANELSVSPVKVAAAEPSIMGARPSPVFGLPPCARRILESGVDSNQRSACFRLAVSLKRSGFPRNLAVDTLRSWAKKNHPKDGKRILTDEEILKQVEGAYLGGYHSVGCEDPAVQPFCVADCPLNRRRLVGAFVTEEDLAKKSLVTNGLGRDELLREEIDMQNEETKRKPDHEVRLGSIKASVWRSEGKYGPRYSTCVCRLYKSEENDKKWLRSEYFDRHDLLVVGKVLDLAHSWICEHMMMEKNGADTGEPNAEA